MSWCYGCHSYMDRRPEEKELFCRKYMGDDMYDALYLRSNQPFKGDKEMIYAGLKVVAKEMGVDGWK